MSSKSAVRLEGLAVQVVSQVHGVGVVGRGMESRTYPLPKSSLNRDKEVIFHSHNPGVSHSTGAKIQNLQKLQSMGFEPKIQGFEPKLKSIN